MPRKTKGPVGHTGQTDAGHTRDVKVERVGPVTIYKRGSSYSLYYREGGVSHRRTVDGNLAVARATASKIASAKADGRPSPIGYHRTTPEQLASGFLDYIANVQGLALRSCGQNLGDFRKTVKSLSAPSRLESPPCVATR